MLDKALKLRVKQAAETDNTILTDEVTPETKGHSTEYLAHLGLERRDLKKLEREGYVVRGYNKVRRPGRIYLKGTETAVVWVLLTKVIGEFYDGV